MNTLLTFCKKYRKPLAIFLFCAAIFLVSVLLHFYFLDTPSRAAHLFFSRLYSGDIEGAYYSTGSDFKKVGSLDQFKEFLIANDVFTRVKDLSLKAQFSGPDSVVLTGMLIPDGSSPSPVSLGLRRFGGVWKLVSIDSQILP